jgi:fructosamine-3-kinase
MKEQKAAAAAGRLLEVDPGEVRLEPIATGKYNTSWFLTTPDQPPLVLQVAPPGDRNLHLFYEHRMMRRLPALHEHLNQELQGEGLIAEVVAQENAVPEVDGHDVIIQHRLQGEPLSDSPGADRESVLQSLGQLLSRVHQIQGPHCGYPQNYSADGAAEDSPAAADTWSAAFQIMWRKLLRDIRDCDGYTQAETARMQDMLDRHGKFFQRPIDPVLLHMDVWDQNILVHEGQFSGLVDWDRALYGDPEIEFAVLDYCGVSTPGFWQGYGQPDPRADQPGAAVRRMFYLLYELQKYIVIRRARQGDADGADSFKERVFALVERSGLG